MAGADETVDDEGFLVSGLEGQGQQQPSSIKVPEALGEPTPV